MSITFLKLEKKSGIQKGRYERKKRRKKGNSVEIAKKLLKTGMDIEQIKDITNLTKEELDKIIEN